MNTPAIARLYRTEMRRIRCRRATRVTLAVLALLVVSGGVRTFMSSSAAAPDLAAAEQLAAAQRDECRAAMTSDGTVFTEQALADICFVDPAWLVVDDSFHLQSLLAGTGDRPWENVRSDSLSRMTYAIDSEGTLRESPAYGFDGALTGFAILVALAAAGLGATWIGADFRSGLFESHAIWMPSRRRLVGAKLAAVATSAAVLSLVGSAALVLALLPSALWRGDADGTGLRFWGDLASTAGRASLGTALFALLAAALALVARNTVAGIAGLAGWSIVASIFADYLGSAAAYLSPYGNLDAFITRGDVSFLKSIRFPDGSAESFMAVSHGWSAAGVVIVALVVLGTFVAGESFARRDIS